MAKRSHLRSDGPSLAELPLTQIDEPELASRETFDEEKLLSLSESIKANGVIQPIIVERQNGRYRIHAGHRRFLASTMAGKESIPAIVYEEGKCDGEALMLHENLYREDLNVGEEASFLSRLLDKYCEGDTDKLCAMVKQNREYVESRLNLLTGDLYVLQALKENKISYMCAREFNKYKDTPLRLAHLDAACRGGATARMVSEWRKSGENIARVDPMQGAPIGNETASTPLEAFRMACVICNSEEEKYSMELMYVHRGLCMGLFRRWLEALYAAGTLGQNTGGENVENG